VRTLLIVSDASLLGKGPGHFGIASEFLRTLPTGSPHAAHPEFLELVAHRVAMAIDAGELRAPFPPR
jgi:hypothetical protein